MFCTSCGANLPDGSAFCTSCGANLQGGPAPVYQAPVPVIQEWDHTAEFTAEDVSENKVIAMACYLLGFIGIIIALLAAKDSAYAKFHSRQALKITVLNTLLGVCAGVLVWTLIVPIAAAVCAIILTVVSIICFFNVAANKSTEPPIVRSFTFLK